MLHGVTHSFLLSRLGTSAPGSHTRPTSCAQGVCIFPCEITDHLQLPCVAYVPVMGSYGQDGVVPEVKSGFCSQEQPQQSPSP